MSQFLVGRQPIFDEKLSVYGYELLFRNPVAASVDGDAMTADVLLHAGIDVGLDDLVGKKKAFVNTTRPFLVGEQELILPSDQTVIEILESIELDEELVKGCTKLVEQGYVLALDDYVWSEGDEPLLDLAAIVKFDILALTEQQVAEQLEICSSFNVTVLAEKVESHEQFDTCRKQGFELFQGYLLSRPETVEGRTLNPSQLSCVRIVDELCDPDFSMRDVERIVETDPALSYKFLRAAGTGAANGLYRQVKSIREGVTLLGERRLRSWVTLMMMADSQTGAEEQLIISLTRARMCELLGQKRAPDMQSSAFTVGLVSSLEILMGVSLHEIVQKLSLTDELVDALLEHSGVLGGILSDSLAWELGGQGLSELQDRELETLERSYMKALTWATNMGRMFENAAA